jgi:putative phage-type endonuclease
MYPKRSEEQPPPVILSEDEINDIENKIQTLRDKPQPAQRTEEWYTLRNGIITASNAYKAFGSEALMNQLIYEKCKPNIEILNGNVNINSPFHWGQKYEPLSVMLYEYRNKTKIEDFGCIKHSEYDFLGASPDGINVEKTSHLFGRLLEIKNVVSRQIDGVPKKEYWVQMQMQMEVCNLDGCDFLECSFKEYEDLDDFNSSDPNLGYYFHKDIETGANINLFKGIIMYFSKDGIPTYIYKPLFMGELEFNEWSKKQRLEQEQDGQIWVRNIYWKEEVYSCVYVRRNRQWFNDNLPQFKKIWNTIEETRKTGTYADHAPNTIKRAKKINVDLDKHVYYEVKKSITRYLECFGYAS